MSRGCGTVFTDGSTCGKADKVAYVKAQRQTRDHHCHWPGCDKQVKPSVWGCYEHWMKLPYALRQKIWATFRPGQEKNWSPSREYVAVAREVQNWIIIKESGL